MRPDWSSYQGPYGDAAMIAIAVICTVLLFAVWIWCGIQLVIYIF